MDHPDNSYRTLLPYVPRLTVDWADSAPPCHEVIEDAISSGNLAAEAHARVHPRLGVRRAG